MEDIAKFFGSAARQKLRLNYPIAGRIKAPIEESFDFESALP